MLKPVKQRTKELLRAFVPLSARKRLCVWINSGRFLGTDLRYWWTMELLKDFMEKDRNEFHRFLWSNHLAYASSYEVEERFGEGNVKGSRRLFFSDLEGHLRSLGLDPAGIRSIFEVGCSLGYQLRYLETGLFTTAETIEGIDIDAEAIEKGSAYLKGAGSRIRLFAGDMGDMDELLAGKAFDIIICTGVLMYLDEAQAGRVVNSIMRHCTLAAFSGLAHAAADNSQLARSITRERDGSFIHNIDSMVEGAGGIVRARRWEGDRKIDDNSIYFVFASGHD